MKDVYSQIFMHTARGAFCVFTRRNVYRTCFSHPQNKSYFSHYSSLYPTQFPIIAIPSPIVLMPNPTETHITVVVLYVAPLIKLNITKLFEKYILIDLCYERVIAKESIIVSHIHCRRIKQIYVCDYFYIFIILSIAIVMVL